MLRMTLRHWLVKSEPSSYSWEDLVKDQRTSWDGVRNFEARNNLRRMTQGDRVLFYHSNQGKQIVGLAQVVKEPYADPKARDGDWSAVDLAPVKPLKVPVGLATIQGEPLLAKMSLLKRSRLSVQPVSDVEFRRILELAQTKA